MKTLSINTTTRLMKRSITLLPFILILIYFSCNLPSEQASTPEEHFNNYCTSCHLTPSPANIPKDIWEKKVLPEMAARLGYKYDGYDPLARNTMEENLFIRMSGVYPSQPLIDSITWMQIHDYVISNAPDKIETDTTRNQRNVAITQFSPKPISLDSEDLSVITNIQFDSLKNHFIVGNALGKTVHWPSSAVEVPSFDSPLISYHELNDATYFTEIGFMNPSEKPFGVTSKYQNGQQTILAKELHRPVYSQVVDLDDDQVEEVLICEFGNLTGQLSMLIQAGEQVEKRTLLALPGIIRTAVADLNKDGKKDIIALASQGKEGVYILYQEEDLTFRLEHVIKMGSEYGSSWFQLMDYNGDDHLDIVLVNGDNADYSIFSKPYHGVRIFMNDGENQFEEKWFYPIYGATRVLANDYDLDGDIDLAVMSFFPDFEFVPQENFVYLENKNAANFDFESSTFSTGLAGRFLVMDDGDFDGDGDIDILLGSFMLFPGKKFKSITDDWLAEKADLFLLENR